MNKNWAKVIKLPEPGSSLRNKSVEVCGEVFFNFQNLKHFYSITAKGKHTLSYIPESRHSSNSRGMFPAPPVTPSLCNTICYSITLNNSNWTIPNSNGSKRQSHSNFFQISTILIVCVRRDFVMCVNDVWSLPYNTHSQTRADYCSHSQLKLVSNSSGHSNVTTKQTADKCRIEIAR